MMVIERAPPLSSWLAMALTGRWITLRELHEMPADVLDATRDGVLCGGLMYCWNQHEAAHLYRLVPIEEALSQ